MDWTDADLLERIRKSDGIAERYLYQRCKPLVFEFLFRRDPQRRLDKLDLYQEVMAVVFIQIREGKLDNLTARLTTYVTAVARNMVMNGLRAKDIMASGSDLPDIAEDVDETITLQEDMEKEALAMVKLLQPPCSELLLDWYIARLRYDQIARKHRYKNENMAKKKKGECIEKARNAVRTIRQKYTR